MKNVFCLAIEQYFANFFLRIKALLKQVINSKTLNYIKKPETNKQSLKM